MTAAQVDQLEVEKMVLSHLSSVDQWIKESKTKWFVIGITDEEIAFKVRDKLVQDRFEVRMTSAIYMYQIAWELTVTRK